MVTLGQIHLLIGLNFQKWRNQVEFYMSMNLNMDMCLNEDQPEELDEDNTAADKKYYNDWWRANGWQRMSSEGPSQTLLGAVWWNQSWLLTSWMP